jgi:hypothetical protein
MTKIMRVLRSSLPAVKNVHGITGITTNVREHKISFLVA